MDEREWRRDGWEAETRIGLRTPAGAVGPEAELSATCPATVTIPTAVELLALAPLDVIGFGVTSCWCVIGRDGEREMCATGGIVLLDFRSMHPARRWLSLARSTSRVPVGMWLPQPPPICRVTIAPAPLRGVTANDAQFTEQHSGPGAQT